MRTRKSLLPIVLLCVTVVGLAICQEKRWPKTTTKHRDKSAKGKYDPDYADRTREDSEELYYDRSSAMDYGPDALDKLKTQLAYRNAYRNNRAIDNSRSTDVGFKNNQQSSQSSNLPKSHMKSSEEVGREKGRRYKNVTIADGICQSIDIRNSVGFFAILRDCRVIEGFLQIVLIENNTEADFENVSFPELREITGYFLLYRVDGLKSLSKLFPNLEVIRGDILLTDYAFMIYEMKNLQEIGLTSLTKISRGGVRIEKNPSLCFTNTVNWSFIVPAGENFIKENVNEQNCPHMKGCSQCPGGYCWTAQHCQLLERSTCHEQCLGKCYGPSDSECYVCKHFRHDGRCIDSCPPNLYAYLSRRCISKDECQKMNQFRRLSKTDETWRPFNNSCVTQCPDGYEDDVDEKNATTCRICTGQCRKIGNGAIIRHISDAQSFRGITVVKGALEFQIRNGNPNIMNELADAFGLIEEITEYVKITHSFPITSLDFFKKLKVIKGEILDINNASFVVLDNPNLSSLFPSSQNITIERGRLFFHYNPKLCLSKIEQFGKTVNITNFTDLEVQPESNGDKVACNIVNINITIMERAADYVNLTWDSYKPSEGQQLLNYLLNYIETENENVMYEANACGNNTWQTVDVGTSRNSTVSKNITNLKPYTKYAAYVKTFTARNKNSFISPVGQSEIIFFRTKSAIPSVPTNVSTTVISDSEILLKWAPPVYPNGPIGYYMISGTFQPDDEKELIDSRDYCIDTLVSETEKEEIHEVTIKTPLISNPNSCCSKDASAKLATSKQFEIFCHKNMTISYLSPGWKDYCVFNTYNSPDSRFYDLANNLSSAQEKQKAAMNVSSTITGSNIAISHIDNEVFVYNVTAGNNSYHLKNLRHYSLYTITIAACGVKVDDDTPMCSSIQYANARTKMRPNADDIQNVKVHVSNDTIVEVIWESVKNPNAFTVSYTIEYTNLDVKDAKKSTECIRRKAPYTGHKERYNNHYIKNLSPGRYSLRIRSTSLAGDGTFTKVIYFSIGLSDHSQIILATLLTIVVLLVSMIVVTLLIKSHQKKRTQERLIASANPPNYITETKYVIDGWEVPRENVEILEELGLGNFGMVYRGYLDGTVQVAIKTISENASQREKNEFLNEASVMKNFSTWHIIKLLGVVSMGNPPFVIMELMENGDLKTYLRRIRDTQLVPDASRIMRMAAEIADGMAYLESKKFVHRDLAARNCMVSKDLVCKIGDFGMARDIYETDYYKIGKKGLLPIRWMAPENLSDGVFTSDSDVWSFGVVLYEILTLAEIPYQGFSNEEVLHHVLRKGMLHIPRNCPETVQKIMEKCFKWRPSERPTFMEIVAELEPFLNQDFCEKSFYHSDEGIEIRSLGIKKVYHNAAPIRFHWGHETARWVKDFEDNVTLLDQMKAGTSRGRIFKNGFQHFGNVTNFEDVPLDR